ncbi:MAG: cation:proton antiporter [Candidatus Schekmanbacteria bacterium]|nr:cation:proton antiporter [Candidatus Schekmanbacteria bacterium]
MLTDVILASKVVLVILSITIFLCLYRAILGPTVYDRIIGINVIGTKAVVMFALLAVIFGKSFFFDMALIYALLLYVTTIAFVKYMGSGRLD